MKKISLLTVVFSLFTLTIFGQNTDLAQFFETYKKEKGFTHAFLSKDLYELANELDVEEKDWRKLHNLISNIGSLQLLVGEQIEDGVSLYKEAKNLINVDEFDQIFSVRDEDDRVHLWTKDNSGSLTDLVLLVGSSNDFVLVSFVGNINLQNALSLVDLFDVDDATLLAKKAQQYNTDFALSPNPATDVFQIQMSNQEDMPVAISIFNANGAVVLTQNLDQQPNPKINCGKLENGTYWVQVRTANGKLGVKSIQVIK